MGDDETTGSRPDVVSGPFSLPGELEGNSRASAFEHDGHVFVPSTEYDSQRPQTMPISSSISGDWGRAYYKPKTERAGVVTAVFSGGCQSYQRTLNRLEPSENFSPQSRKTMCSQVDSSTWPKSRESWCMSLLSLRR